MSRIGFYPGSFDPPTFGHLDMVAASTRLCDILVIGIGVHPAKTPMFPALERQRLLEAECGPVAAGRGCRLDITTFNGLAVEAAAACGATLMFRGLRDGTDLDYELQLAGMNAAMAPGIQTVLLPPTSRTRHITATLVRQIAQLGGDVTPFVPRSVAAALADVIRAR